MTDKFVKVESYQVLDDKGFLYWEMQPEFDNM